MKILGTRGITYAVKNGKFHCFSCAAQQLYKRKRVRRFLALYFIPLIPLDLLGEYVECQNCKNTFNLKILEYDPQEQAFTLEAEYQIAIKRVMIEMMLADKVIDDSEMKMIKNIYYRIANTNLSDEEIRQEISNVENSPEDFFQYLTSLAGKLNDTGKESVITAALYVAFADGEFVKEEKATILNIGYALGMHKKDIQCLIKCFEWSITFFSWRFPQKID